MAWDSKFKVRDDKKLAREGKHSIRHLQNAGEVDELLQIVLATTSVILFRN